MKQLVVAAVCLAVWSVADARSSRGRADPQLTPGRPALMLEQIKALEGVWETRLPDGSVYLTQYTVTAGGSAVREVMFPGTDREMTNMYHMDGDVLVVTHYGTGGIQPRMRAWPDLRGQIEFEFESASNLEPGTDYVGQLKLRMRDPNTLVQEWTSYSGRDQPPKITRLEFRRRTENANVDLSIPTSGAPVPAVNR